MGHYIVGKVGYKEITLATGSSKPPTSTKHPPTNAFNCVSRKMSGMEYEKESCLRSGRANQRGPSQSFPFHPPSRNTTVKMLAAH